MTATRSLEQRERWGIECRVPGGRWALIGTLGTQAECMRWIPRLWAKNADFRIRRPINISASIKEA